MRFYNRQHRHYCGIDLHVKTMYICILDGTGHVLVHRNVRSTPEAFLETIAPYRTARAPSAEYRQSRMESSRTLSPLSIARPDM